jgi:hypothetical protein
MTRNQVRIKVFKQFQYVILFTVVITAIIMYRLFPMWEATITLFVLVTFVECVAAIVLFLITYNIPE